MEVLARVIFTLLVIAITIQGISVLALFGTMSVTLISQLRPLWHLHHQHKSLHGLMK